jgi:hypothetical protein
VSILPENLYRSTHYTSRIEKYYIFPNFGEDRRNTKNSAYPQLRGVLKIDDGASWRYSAEFPTWSSDQAESQVSGLDIREEVLREAG